MNISNEKDSEKDDAETDCQVPSLVAWGDLTRVALEQSVQGFCRIFASAVQTCSRRLRNSRLAAQGYLRVRGTEPIG